MRDTIHSEERVEKGKETRAVADNERDDTLKYVHHVMDTVGLSPDYAREIAALERTEGHNSFSLPPDLVSGAHRPAPLLRFLRIPFWFFYYINVQKLEQKLSNALDGMGVGYSFLIRRKGVAAAIRSAGWAQRPGDGDLPWRFDVPMDAGSIAKIVTAAAVLRLLDAAGVSETSPVQPYLPTYWGGNADIGRITWRDLLRHESGLGAAQSGSGPTSYKAGREAIGQGVSNYGSYSYKNANYIILRVAAAVLAGAIDRTLHRTTTKYFMGVEVSKSLDVKASDELWNGITAVWYIQYVNDNVFGRAGLQARNLKSPPEAAKAYYYPSSGKGSRLEDAVDQAGAGGWHLDVNELTRLMDHLRRRGTILPTGRAHDMLINHYGIDGEFGTSAGPVYSKNGRCTVKDDQCLDTLVLFMPGNLSLALFVNAAPQGAPGTPAIADPPALSFTMMTLMVIASIEFGFS